MSIKLIALDMDGTLLNSNKQLPPDFIPWLKSHPRLKTVIASGRQYFTLAKDFPSVANQIIFAAENGGIVFEKGQILYLNEMQKEDILTCLRLIEPHKNLTPIVCGAKSAYMKPSKQEIYREAKQYYDHLQITEHLHKAAAEDNIIKIAIFAEQKTAEAAITHFTSIPAHLAAVLSGDCWIDIANKSVNKGAAILAVQQKYGIDRTESMAFGDYLNDTELLKSCEESYCMQNGHPDLKSLAKHITASNDEDGVMKALYQWEDAF